MRFAWGSPRNKRGALRRVCLRQVRQKWRTFFVASPWLGVVLSCASCSGGPDPDVKSSYPYGRYLGALELAENPNAENVRQIVELLSDPEPLVRSGAVVALGKIGRAEFVQHLIPLLDPQLEASALVRSDVCIAFQTLKNPQAIPQLLTCLRSDPEGAVRREAAKGLPAFGKKDEILEALVQAIADPDPGAAWRAHVSLQELTGAKEVAMTTEAWAAYLKDRRP